MISYSPKSFARHCLELIDKEIVSMMEGLVVVTKIIEKTAKDEIGHYQSAKGNFPAWAALTDSTVADKEKHGYAPPDNPLLRNGSLRKSIKSETNGLEGIVGSTSQIMVYHEFGTSKMAMRPVIGPAAFVNKKKIHEIIGLAVVSGFYGKGMPIHESLGYNFKTDEG
jgi:HK97 gp10 family phage protein